MLPGSPLIWLCAVLTLATPVTYAVTKVNAERQIRAAYADGKSAGMGASSTQTVASAGKTAAAERQAETDVPPVPTDRAKLIERCNRAASCRDRGKFQ